MHGCRNPTAWPVPSPRFGGELNEPRCEPAPVVSASVTVVACSCEHCQVCVALCCVLFCSVCLRPAAISVLWWVAGKSKDIAHYFCITQRTMCLCCFTLCCNPNYVRQGVRPSPASAGGCTDPVGTRFHRWGLSFCRRRNLLCLHVLRIPPYVISRFVLFRLGMSL